MILYFIAALFSAQMTFAEGGAWETSGFMGPMLPDQIDGVAEIQPTLGLRYGLKSEHGSSEFTITSSKAKGVEYYTGQVGLRGDIPLEDLMAIFTLGLNAHYYLPPRHTQFRTYGGLYLGSGLMAHLGGPVWFRSDMQFNFHPGVALVFSFGFLLRWGDAKAEGATATP